MTLQACTEIFIVIIQQYFSTRAAKGSQSCSLDVQQSSILLKKDGKGSIHATVRAAVASFNCCQCRKLVEVFVQRWKCRTYFLWHQILVHQVLPCPAGTSILQYIQILFKWTILERDVSMFQHTAFFNLKSISTQKPRFECKPWQKSNASTGSVSFMLECLKQLKDRKQNQYPN